MHGLIFFYLQKFSESLSTGAPAGSRSGLSSLAVPDVARYLPSNVYPDADAVQFLQMIADGLDEPLLTTTRRFGEFLAPHLVKVAGPLIDPSWRTLDLVEHTEDLIHAMVRTRQPGADPPVLETVRSAPDELHVVYASRRRLCSLATGLLRGLARHYGELIELDETSCMLRGDPFCSFVIRTTSGETQTSHSPVTETVVLMTQSAASRFRHEDPGLLPELGGLADDPLPTSIGGYRVLGLIGSGAMGRVYLAHDEHLDRNVAIKVLNPARAVIRRGLNDSLDGRERACCGPDRGCGRHQSAWSIAASSGRCDPQSAWATRIPARSDLTASTNTCGSPCQSIVVAVWAAMSLSWAVPVANSSPPITSAAGKPRFAASFSCWPSFLGSGKNSTATPARRSAAAIRR